MQPTQEQKGAAFRALHERETFVIPNPWDAGSARVLAALGFEALATTSSGFAFTLGRLDGAATLDEVIDHTRALAAATSLPVSVDLENGHGPAPEDADPLRPYAAARSSPSSTRRAYSSSPATSTGGCGGTSSATGTAPRSCASSTRRPRPSIHIRCAIVRVCGRQEPSSLNGVAHTD